MSSSIHFFKDCMYRLSEISVRISQLNKMRKELEEMISGSASTEEEKWAALNMQRIEAALKTFINTETRIVHTMKKNENYPRNVYVLYDETRFAVSNEEYLSKVMRHHRNQFLELESTVNEFSNTAENKGLYQKL